MIIKRTNYTCSTWKAWTNLSLQKELNAYIVVNRALTQYLKELERIDINRFREETAKYNELVCSLENAKNEKELNLILHKELQRCGIKPAWTGNIGDHLSNKNGTFVFG